MVAVLYYITGRHSRNPFFCIEDTSIVFSGRGRLVSLSAPEKGGIFSYFFCFFISRVIILFSGLQLDNPPYNSEDRRRFTGHGRVRRGRGTSILSSGAVSCSVMVEVRPFLFSLRVCTFSRQ